MIETVVCKSPDDTFNFGEKLGRSLNGGEVVLLTGGLGAGKTLLTKGILGGLEFDIDEVTSPSFTLVNLYNAKHDVYHIDLWRIDPTADAAAAVGLYEILENDKAVVVIEWAERLNATNFQQKVININIEGDGDDARKLTVETEEQNAASVV